MNKPTNIDDKISAKFLILVNHNLLASNGYFKNFGSKGISGKVLQYFTLAANPLVLSTFPCLKQTQTLTIYSTSY